jgi:GT2 family glycosyltransferase
VQQDPVKVIFPPVEDPDASVVVLGWCLRDELLNCLSALSQNVGSMSFEVIVVLHGADEDVKAAVRDQVVGATVVETPINLGFGSGCNIGASKARGQFLVFLNDDTIPSADWLDRLTSAARRTPTAGAISSRLYFPDGRLQEAGARLVAEPEGIQIGRGWASVPDELLKPRPIDYGGAAALLVHRRLFVQLGGFDQRYDPAYFEDVDLCLRIRAAGWAVYYEPTAVVTHLQFSSTRDRVEWRQFAFMRSQGIFRNRWRHVLSHAAQIDDPLEQLVPSPGPDDVGTLDLQTQVEASADPSVKGRELVQEYANWLTSHLRSAQAAVTYLNQTLTAAQARGAALETALTAAQARTAALETALAAVQAQAAALEVERVERHRLAAVLAAKEAERIAVDNALRLSEDERDRLATALTAKEAERIAVDTSLRAAELERQRMHATLTVIFQSRSWRWTAPLRGTNALCRRVLPRAPIAASQRLRPHRVRTAVRAALLRWMQWCERSPRLKQ